MGIKIVRSEGGVVFLVRECLVDEVEFITDVHYEESVWMKVRGRRGSSAFYIGLCICLLIVQIVLALKVVMKSLKRMLRKGKGDLTWGF